MAIDYEALKAFPFEDRIHAYTAKDTILYALGIGLGTDPIDPRELRFVYERELLALPTMGAVLALARPWIHLPRSGITWNRMLHGEQGLVIHRAIAPADVLVGETAVEEVVDKGPQKGALLYMRRTVRRQSTGEAVFTATQTLFCRADGGFCGPVTHARPVHELPEREPDLIVDLPTSKRAALIYRLSGDTNPLHVDPQVASAAGFERPILHGLCTFGLAGYGILRSVANYRPQAMRSIKARFSAPVFPGESVRMQVWDEGGGRYGFRCRVPARDVMVINNGIAEVH